MRRAAWGLMAVSLLLGFIGAAGADEAAEKIIRRAVSTPAVGSSRAHGA